MYGSVVDTKGVTVSLNAILNEIKKGKWEDSIDRLRSIGDEDQQKACKNKMPCFTPSGTFQDRKVLIQHTGILVFDFDAKDNPGLLNECSEHRQLLSEDEYTHFMFSSCRGEGLAVGVRIDPGKHLKSFLYLENYYRDKYELKADKGCKDINRLRFISYDPNLYINENSKVLQIFEEKKELSSDDIIKQIIASGRLIGNDTYDEWYRIGLGLATEFGEAGRQYFHALSMASAKYSHEDCEKKYDDCMRGNRGEVGLGTIITYAKQAGVDIRCNKQKPNKIKESNTLKDEIIEWIEEHDGEILLVDLYRDLNLSDKSDKANARKVISRLSKDGIINPDGKKSGCYKKIDIDCPKIDWKNADLTEVPVAYPLGLEKMIVTLRKTIIVIAGVSDAGKSVFLMQFAAMNTGKGFPIRYYSSEMGDAELKFRILRTNIPNEVWDEVDFRERCVNFDQVIDPHGINIIDYLEIYENPYMIGERIKEIFNRLKTGIVVLAIQKDSGKEFGWGGIASMHKSRLYINIDYETMTIKKAKNKRYMETSLRDKKIKFEINKGILEPKSEWFK